MTDTSTAGTGKRIELTIRALVLGAVLGVIFTAANVYIGLRVGLTFASAIPAAVISMALLRTFKTSTIWENMTVQTVASVGGAMSSIIFVLPGLVMVGWWKGFPFWESVAICVFGGVLGVTFSIPLRRALVVNTDLPYPEGVAAAEVLKVGSRGADQTEEAVRENKAGLVTVTVGAIASTLFAWLTKTRIFLEEATIFWRNPASLGGGASGFGGGMSMALLGAGHLIGLGVGLAMLVGLFLAWGVGVPLLTSPGVIAWLNQYDIVSPATTLDPGYGVKDLAEIVWSKQVRLMGAGAIGVAAVWTLIKLAGPLVAGVTSAMAAQAKRAANIVLDRTEMDIPIGLVGMLSLVTLAAIAGLLWFFSNGTPLAPYAPLLVAGGLVYVLVIGLVVASVCGYMAGLIGSSNSPVSGVGILAILVAAVLMLGVLTVVGLAQSPEVTKAVVAYSLLVTAIVFAISVISNDNLQDLKTGQLVGATPWRQQVALLVGVLAGSLVIPPILDLLNGAYGFVGGPIPTVVGAKPLDAPQATLISLLATRVIDHDMAFWRLLGIGGVLGVAIIAVDEAFRATTKKWRLPPLAVTLGIYLPVATVSTVVVGAVIGRIYDVWVGGTRYAGIARRLGILLASGLIVGESLFGVFTAAVIVSTQKNAPFALLSEDSAWPAMLAGMIGFAVVIIGLYIWTRGKASKV